MYSSNLHAWLNFNIINILETKNLVTVIYIDAIFGYNRMDTHIEQVNCES